MTDGKLVKLPIIENTNSSQLTVPKMKKQERVL